MHFEPRRWYPIALALSAVNLAAVWFAARPAEPLHATLHAGLAVAFGVWAYHLRRVRRTGELGEHIAPLAFEVEELRRELAETQERLNFAERVLTQAREPRREGREE